MRIIDHFVNGKSFPGSSKKTSDVFNPATGEVSAKVNLATKKDVDQQLTPFSSLRRMSNPTPRNQVDDKMTNYTEILDFSSSDNVTEVVEFGRILSDYTRLV